MARIPQVGLCFLAAFIGFAEIGRSQAMNLDNVYTPAGLEPGTPAHSYALGDFDNISYFNGHLNFHLPLREIGGRGQAAYTLTLPIEGRFDLESAWSTQFAILPDTFVPDYFPLAQGDWEPYSPGSLGFRVTGSLEDTTCTLFDGSTAQYSIMAVTRLVFIEPDGTRHELRDVQTDGAPQSTQCPPDPTSGQPPPPGFDRGRVFLAQDSSGLKFVASQDVMDYAVITPGSINYGANGVLYFPDGRAYTANNGRVTQIRDRNGNVVTLTYTGTIGAAGGSIQIIDSAGRQITVTSSGTQDLIQYTGFAGAARNIAVNYAALGAVLRTDYTMSPPVTCSDGSVAPAGIQTLSQLFPESLLNMPQCSNPMVVASVVLADNQSYQFHYNPYGELARVDLPTGGAYEYDIGGVFGASTSGAIGIQGKAFNDGPPFMLYRRVTERRVYKAPGVLEGKIDISVPPFAPGTDGTVTTVTAYDSAGTALSTETHSFYALPTTELYCQGDNACSTSRAEWFPSWQEGKEFETDWLQVGSSTVLRKLRHSWFNAAATASPKAAVDPPPASDPSLDPHVLQTDTTLDTGVVGRQTFGYDTFNNLTDSSDYDYASTPPGQLLRHMHTDYIADTNYMSGAVYLPSLPILQRIDLGNTTTIYSQTQYQYDNYSGTAACPDSTSVPVLNAPQPGSLCTHANIVEMDPAYVSGGITQRGNVTRVQRTGSPSPDIFTYQQYDVAGSVVRRIDANGNQTQLDYDSNSNIYAFLSRRTDALGHLTSLSWDLSVGKPISIKDPNQQATGFDYTDPLDRLKTIDYPDGGQTIFSYPSPTQIQQTQKITSSLSKLTTSIFDGLGRFVQTQLSDPEGTDYVDTSYGPNGRVSSISNSHRSTASSTDGITHYIYDPLGRTCVVVPPDGTIPSPSTSCPTTPPAGDVFTSYSGNCTTVTDEAQKARKSCVDALGRLTSVWEDPAGLNYPTNYAYDANNNLTSVVQNGSRQRTFSYDSLSRLRCAANPEVAVATCPSPDNGAYTQGTIGYSYDPNGNLVTKIAPAPNQTGSATVTTTYQYDALNRLTQKSYSDGVTRVAGFYYDSRPSDTFTNAIGRLVTTWDGTSEGSIYNYDPIGRITSELFCVDPAGCWMASTNYYTYDLLGDITSYTNTIQPWNGAPTSTITFSQSFDSVGRVTNLTSSLVDPQHPATLATVDPSIGYYPTGAIQKLTLGNGLTETAAYNNRLQPCRMNVNFTGGYYRYCNDGAPGGNVLDFTYGFNLETADNGNVTSWSASGQQNFNRSYLYDSVNRLQSMSAPGDSCSGLSWSVDPWGNRTDQTVTAGACNTFHQAVDTSNRLLGAPFQYDAAGNMIHDASHSYTYDAENRLIQVDGGATATYYYDPSGRRVAKTTGGATLNYVYDLAGNPLFETQGSSWTTAYIYFVGALHAQYKNNTTYFLHRDHLGSTRLVTAIPTVDVRFTNDSCSACGGNPVGGGDRNLFVNSVTVGSMTVPPNDPSVSYLTPPCNSFSNGVGVLACNGDMLVATTPQASAQTITVNAYGSPDYSIYPHLQLLVNGTVVGQWDVTGSAQNYTVSVPIAPWAYDSMDYLPFSEQIAGDTGTTHKFTGKERDSESGFDYFGARYLSGVQGRFTSPDAYGVDQHPEDPQSWNLYAYGRNNPIKFVDPSGEYVCADNITRDQCDNFQKSLDLAQAAANQLKDKYGADSTEYTDAQRAIDAYGKKDIDNGVLVKMGDPGAGAGGRTDVAGERVARTNANPEGQNIVVTLRESAFNGSATAGLTAEHEGSHVADASDWVKSGFSDAMNPTAYGTEFRAYQSTVDLAGAMGRPEITFQGKFSAVTVGAGWEASTRAYIINKFLMYDYGFAWTPGSKLKAFSRNTRLVR
jgi:RHS repeat-associated protein